jgi:hypothetical protein
MELSIGDVLDRYVTEMLRCWHLNDYIATESDDAKVAKAARDMLQANARRVVLRAELTRRLDPRAENIEEQRTYGGT